MRLCAPAVPRVSLCLLAIALAVSPAPVEGQQPGGGSGLGNARSVVFLDSVPPFASAARWRLRGSAGRAATALAPPVDTAGTRRGNYASEGAAAGIALGFVVVVARNLYSTDFRRELLFGVLIGGFGGAFVGGAIPKPEPAGDTGTPGGR